MTLDSLLTAADAAISEPIDDLSDLVLRAANALPPDAPDFDRGMAAGVALCRHLDQQKDE